MKKLFICLLCIYTPLSAYASESVNKQLIQYSWQGDINSVKSLFVDLNYKNIKGQTALYVAACQGNTDIVKFLITKGANVNSKNLNNATPLMCAVWNKHFKTATFMLDNGGDINNKDKWGNAVKIQLMHHLKNLK